METVLIAYVLFSLNAFSNLCVNQRISPSYIYD